MDGRRLEGRRPACYSLLRPFGAKGGQVEMGEVRHFTSRVAGLTAAAAIIAWTAGSSLAAEDYNPKMSEGAKRVEFKEDAFKPMPAYEDLDYDLTAKLIDDLKAGKAPEVGSMTKRQGSMSKDGPTSLVSLKDSDGVPPWFAEKQASAGGDD